MRASQFSKSRAFPTLSVLLLLNLNYVLSNFTEFEEFDFINQHQHPSNKSSKILSGPSRPSYPRPGPGHHGGQGQGDLSVQGSGNNPSVQQHPAISDIDMQLLGAMEKLVGRMDGLEARVKTLESIVHYFTNKEKPPQQQQQPEKQRPNQQPQQQPQRGETISW